MRNRKAVSQQKRRKEISNLKKQIKAERGCKICNENRWYMLVFHHKNTKSKKFEISDMNIGQVAINNRGKLKLGDNSRGGNYFNKTKLLEEIAKCDIYCMNHHAELHYLQVQMKEV